MKVFCLVPNLHANGAGLNFKSNLRPAALARFTKRENFKNFVTHEQVAKATNREAVSTRRTGYTCSGAKTARTMPIDTAASKNISNFAPLKHCADRKNFKIFASGKIKFTTHGELKFTMRGMAKFTAPRGLKFEPCGAAVRDFALRDKILSSRPCKNCASFKISPPRGEETK
mgnify:FL=1